MADISSVDLDQAVVSRAVLLAHEMHVIGGHHLDAQLLRYLEYHLIDLLLMGESALLRPRHVGLVPLHLQIIVVTEDGLVPRRYALRLLQLSLHDGLRHLSAQTGRAADYTLVVLLYKLVVNARLVVEALNVSLRRELDEVVVAIHVLGQHDQMVGTLVLAALAVGFNGASFLATVSRNSFTPNILP